MYRLSNTIPTVMNGAGASCCVGVFQHLLQGSWSVMKKCWMKQRGSRLSQRSDWNPTKYLYRDVKMAVHRHTPQNLTQNNKLWRGGMSTPEKTDDRTIENRPTIPMKTVELIWVLTETSWYWCGSCQILNVYSSNNTSMVLKMFLMKDCLVKHLKINLGAFTLTEMHWVHFKLIMVVQRDRKICFCHWPNNYEPFCADNLDKMCR